jgi:hypothetical protein
MVYKSLKFTPELVPLILCGEKKSTWRINDEKNLMVGDEIVLINKQTLQEFSKAIIMQVREILFKDLTEQDKDIHESYPSTSEMYQAYSKYYGVIVNEHTPLKIIRFKLKN